MEINITGDPKEIAALVTALQGRPEETAEQVAQEFTACLDRAMRDIS